MDEIHRLLANRPDLLVQVRQVLSATHLDDSTKRATMRNLMQQLKDDTQSSNTSSINLVPTPSNPNSSMDTQNSRSSQSIQ
jgi:hypothetical protein